MKACYENDVWIATLRMDFNFQDEYCQRVFMIEAEESARHLEWMKLILGGGKATASNNGYYDGRWLVPGYLVDRSDEKRKKYIIYEPHAQVVRWLFRRFLELDGNFRALCREVEQMPFLFPAFEDWVDKRDISRFRGNGEKRGSLIKEGPYAGNYKATSSGIKSILCNPVCIGWWIPIDGGLVENNHEPIVDEILFAYAYKRLSSYDLSGKRQKPERVTRSGEAEGIIKKVLHDDRDKLMYPSHDVDKDGKAKNRYISLEVGDLYNIYRYSISMRYLDNIFLEKLFERLAALEKLEDWEDRLKERQAAREEAQAYNKRLIQKQIDNARRQRTETLSNLNDPDIPKTKQMKIDYALQIAGLEEKIQQWEIELAASEDEEDDEEITLYQIHSLLPNIKSEWNKLSFGVRLRFVGALVQKAVLTLVSPSWVKLEIYWKKAIGDLVDIGHFKRQSTKGPTWSQEEETVLREMYSKADAAELLAAFPNRTWSSIALHANEMRLIRDRGRKPNSVSTVYGRCETQEDREYAAKNGLISNDKNAQWSVLWASPLS